MKNLKKFSLAIAMLITFLTFGQEKKEKDTVVINTKVSKDKIIKGRECGIGREVYPLFVLDGKIISIEEFRAINPETIESMSILKDSITGTFCRRPNNGVIVIKSKKLSKRELRKMKKNKD